MDAGLSEALQALSALQHTKDVGLEVKDYSSALSVSVAFPVGFWTYLEPITPFFCLFFLSGMECLPCPVPPLYLGNM
jgi:hypothetical protein